VAFYFIGRRWVMLELVEGSLQLICVLAKKFGPEMTLTQPRGNSLTLRRLTNTEPLEAYYTKLLAVLGVRMMHLLEKTYSP
jgi:hypothetical protein